MCLLVPCANPFALLSFLRPFSSEVGHPSLRAHLVTTVLSAPRERRQGGAPSLRRPSQQPRTCSRAPLLATTTRLHTVAQVRRVAWGLRPSGPPRAASAPPGLRRPRCQRATRRTGSRPVAGRAPRPRSACHGGPLR